MRILLFLSSDQPYDKGDALRIKKLLRVSDGRLARQVVKTSLADCQLNRRHAVVVRRTNKGLVAGSSSDDFR